MKVGDSIRKAIDDWQQGDLEAAMLHACNALDGTAGKRYPNSGNKDRFTRCLREGYRIFGAWAAPGIDLESTRWPVNVQRPTALGGEPDIADIVYGIHRCAHCHGDGLQDGFELLPAGAGSEIKTEIERGKVRLSDRAIFGLIAVAVFSPENADQRVPEGYFLTFAGDPLPINNWWGRAADFERMLAQHPSPVVKLDFSNWGDD